MVINRYLTREVTAALAATFILLMLIFVSTTFVRILADAAEGDYPGDVVFTLFGLKVLSNLALVLPLSFFLAVLIALGRLYKDSEMAAMAACGIGPSRVLRVVFWEGFAVAAVVAGLALYLSPWAAARHQQVLDEVSARPEIENLVAGRFNQAGEGEHLLYVESISEDRRRLRNVFVHSRQPEGPVLVTARQGHQETDRETGYRYLVLEDGYRYDGQPGRADYKIVEFERHRFRLYRPEVDYSAQRDKAKPSDELWQSTNPDDTAELQRRVSVVLSTLLMGLLAVPLSRTNPRQGRYARLFVGVMIYLVYNNLVTVAETWVAKGRVEPVVGVWWVHALVLALTGALLFVQSGGLPRLLGREVRT